MKLFVVFIAAEERLMEMYVEYCTLQQTIIRKAKKDMLYDSMNWMES